MVNGVKMMMMMVVLSLEPPSREKSLVKVLVFAFRGQYHL